MEQCKKALTRLMAKADPLDVNLNVFIEAVAKAERARVPTQDITKAKARLAEVKVAHDENDQKLRGKDVWMVASSVDRNGTARSGLAAHRLIVVCSPDPARHVASPRRLAWIDFRRGRPRG